MTERSDQDGPLLTGKARVARSYSLFMFAKLFLEIGVDLAQKITRYFLLSLSRSLSSSFFSLSLSAQAQV